MKEKIKQNEKQTQTNVQVTEMHKEKETDKHEGTLTEKGQFLKTEI